MSQGDRSDPEDGFLSRWARRKADVKGGKAVAAELPKAPVDPEPVLRQAQDDRSPTVRPESFDLAQESPVEGCAQDAVAAPAAEPPPTLDDVAALAPGDEVSRFVARGVDEGVKRAAVKKLFTDPHFNIMDGLDTYIDDYGKPDPIPMAMLRQMNQSKFLGLFAAEEAAEAAAAARSDPASAATGADLAITTPPPPAEDAGAAPPAAAVPHASDEDPDLQLQPDDAAGSGSAEERARTGGR